MGEVAAGLDGHHEAGADPVPPAGEGLPWRQPVEGPVVLDRGELARVVLQPAPLRHVGRVERAAPVPVLPARSTDQNAHSLGPASYELSLIYPSAGKAIPEPVSRTRYIGVACVHAESITWNDGAHERTCSCRR